MKELLFNLHSTFKGVSGEFCVGGQGSLTQFIRLQKCNLNCSYCDTKDARIGTSLHSKEVSIKSMLDIVQDKIGHVLITGGEPLLQYHSVLFFCQIANSAITIETNGSIFWSDFLSLANTSLVVDYKMPSSGMHDRMLPISTFLSLRPNDAVKMVIADDEDFELAIHVLKNDWKYRSFIPLISPMIVDRRPHISVRQIVDRLWKEDLQDVILSAQIHKFLGLQ